MAIQEQSDNTDSQDPKVILTISNGDLKALKSVVDDWQFKDNASVLKFALAVLSQALNKTVFIDNGGGGKIGLKPTEALKKEPANGNEQQAQ